MYHVLYIVLYSNNGATVAGALKSCRRLHTQALTDTRTLTESSVLLSDGLYVTDMHRYIRAPFRTTKQIHDCTFAFIFIQTKISNGQAIRCIEVDTYTDSR